MNKFKLIRKFRSPEESHVFASTSDKFGAYEAAHQCESFKGKHIVASPGIKLREPKHHYRTAFWAGVGGTVNLHMGDQEQHDAANQPPHTLVGSIHSLEKPDRLPLYSIGVQAAVMSAKTTLLGSRTGLGA